MTTACEIPTVQPAPASEPAPVAAAPAVERLLSGRFVRLLVMVFGSGLSMYLLTSVVPLYLAANGSGGIGGGLSTGAMILLGVGVDFLVPRMLSRWGYHFVLSLVLFLLGAPSLVLLSAASLPLVLS